MSAPWLWIVKDGRFQWGPTLPYIVGAMRLHNGTAEIASEDVCRDDLLELMTDMRDEVSPPECISIQPCGTLEALVASARPEPPQGRSFIQSPHHADRGLYYSVGSTGHTLESLFEAMWNEHGEYILQGRFSREQVSGLNGPEWDWVRFDDAERQQIRKTLAAGAKRAVGAEPVSG
jgi:hypothetical protein